MINNTIIDDVINNIIIPQMKREGFMINKKVFS